MSFEATFSSGATVARVTAARVSLPAWGCPVAVAQVAEDTLVPTTGVLVLGDFSQVMTVEETGPYGGSRGIWLVGGANGWKKTIRRQFYSNAQGIKLASVLGDAAALAGESLSLGASFASQVLGQFWNREEAPASRTLALTVGQSWWVDPLGVTQIGDRPTSAIAVDFDPVAPIRPELGTYTIATEDLLPWVPGATFSKPGILDDVLTISSVSISMMVGGKLRLEVMVNL